MPTKKTKSKTGSKECSITPKRNARQDRKNTRKKNVKNNYLKKEPNFSSKRLFFDGNIVVYESVALKNLLKDISAKENDKKLNIFIEGMPGVGNVGKNTVELIVHQLKPKLIFRLYSYYLPHFVILPDLELPYHELYFYDAKDYRLFLYSGVSQAVDDYGTYAIASVIADYLLRLNVNELITIGGLGINHYVENPMIYLSGDKEMVKKYRVKNVSTHPEEKVDAIIGLSGVLLGLAKNAFKEKNKEIKVMSILSEVYVHPLYLGLVEVKNIAILLSKKLNLNLDLKDLDEKIDKWKKSFVIVSNQDKMQESSSANLQKKPDWSSYIG